MLTHRQLVLVTIDMIASITWMKANRYIKNTRICPRCSIEMHFLNTDTKTAFRCPRCRTENSLFSDHLFYNTNLEINLLLDLLYFWSIDMMQCQVRDQIETKSRQTVTNWYRKLQGYCFALERSTTFGKIGGSGLTVQVDESLFSKRKYHVGRLVRKIWVVGGICYETNEVFFVEAIYRTQEALSGIILAHVEVGTTIVTDMWAGYNNFNNLGFFHLTVNHSENFVDHESGANTQLIEGTWSVAKRWLIRRGITNRGDLFFYFVEYCFKRKYRENVFCKLMESAPAYEEILN